MSDEGEQQIEQVARDDRCGGGAGCDFSPPYHRQVLETVVGDAQARGGSVERGEPERGAEHATGNAERLKRLECSSQGIEGRRHFPIAAGLEREMGPCEGGRWLFGGFELLEPMIAFAAEEGGALRDACGVLGVVDVGGTGAGALGVMEAVADVWRRRVGGRARVGGAGEFEEGRTIVDAWIGRFRA